MSWSDVDAKLARAKRRGEQLLTDARDWLSAHGDELSAPVMGSWDEREQDLVFEARSFQRRAPDDWAHELGDIVLDLRAALDYAAWAMVQAGDSPEATADERARRIQFPIVVGPNQKGTPAEVIFARSLRDQLPGIAAELAAVVDHFQPFHAAGSAENHGLAVLLAMSNLAKHRNLHVLVAGQFIFIVAIDALDHLTILRDLVVDEERGGRFRSSGRVGEDLQIENVSYRLGARVTGPNPYAEARFPSVVELLVDTHGQIALVEVVPLLVEVVCDLVDHLHTVSA